LGTSARGRRAFGEARYRCFSTHSARLLTSRTGATRQREDLFAELEDVCSQSRPVHRRLRFPGRGDCPVSNSLCVPPDGGRNTAHRALQRHRTSNCSLDLEQLREAIPSDHSYRFLIHDRDAIFSAEVDQQLKAFGLWVLHTPARAPKANAYCERLVGSVRRECLDFMIPLGKKHLCRILSEWVTHYNQGRLHLSLGPGIPERAVVFPPLQDHDKHSFPQHCKVVARMVLGGLHHEYRWERIAA
jgi:hypothetical protein